MFLKTQRFLFHTGSIKSVVDDDSITPDIQVSIPYWFD